MARQHIGKQTDGEGHRLHKGAEYLDKGHHRLQEHRYVRVENLFIVVLGAVQVHDEEGEQGQHQGYGNVAGEVGASREEGHNAQEIVQKDPEEGHTEVRGELPVIRADVFLSHLVHHQDEGLHQGRQARGSFLQGIVLFVPAGGAENDDKKKEGAHHQGQYVLGDGKVYRPFARLRIHQLAVFVQRIAVLLRMVDGEDVDAAIDDDTGQRNGNRFSLPLRDVPLVLVSDVLEDDFSYINLCLTRLRPLIGRRACEGRRKLVFRKALRKIIFFGHRPKEKGYDELQDHTSTQTLTWLSFTSTKPSWMWRRSSLSPVT